MAPNTARRAATRSCRQSCSPARGERPASTRGLARAAAQLGEMMATTMEGVGAVGLVTDGGLRDIREITALGGFHYYGRGLVVAHGRPCIYDVGARVTIDGMEVHPGDLLHGDENGITVIPAEIAADVAAKALEHREMEQQRLAEILSPDFHKQFEEITQYR